MWIWTNFPSVCDVKSLGISMRIYVTFFLGESKFFISYRCHKWPRESQQQSTGPCVIYMSIIHVKFLLPCLRFWTIGSLPSSCFMGVFFSGSWRSNVMTRLARVHALPDGIVVYCKSFCSMTGQIGWVLMRSRRRSSCLGKMTPFFLKDFPPAKDWEWKLWKYEFSC